MSHLINSLSEVVSNHIPADAIKNTVNLGITYKVNAIIPLLLGIYNYTVYPVQNIESVTWLFSEEFTAAHMARYGNNFEQRYFIILRDLYIQYNILEELYQTTYNEF